MKPVVNLEENPGKVVGRDSARPDDYDRLLESGKGILPRLPYPKGVYRFRTHEEADAWTEHHILQAALKKARARQSEAT